MNVKTLVVLVLGLVALAVLVVLNRRPSPNVPATTPATAEPIAAKPVRKPRLPAPHLAVPTTPVESPDFSSRPTNWLARLLDGEWPAKPGRDALEPYLAANRRNAESLLAAFRATDDKAFLQEAIEKYPKDPQVTFVALFNSQSPEERRRWLNAF